MKIPSLLVLAALATPLLHAQNLLTGLYNTGVNSSGAAIGGDSYSDYLDSHYTSTAGYFGFASIGNLAPGSWVEGATSQWIYPTYYPDATGVIDYQTTFDITGPFSSAEITGQFATDNELVNVILNGVSLGIGDEDSGGFSYWTPFSITNSADFVEGTNTLVFETNNDGGPGGVNVEMTGSASAAPDSASAAWLLAGGLLALGAASALERKTARAGA